MSERILLIDDDDSIRKVIGYMLDEARYAAGDGRVRRRRAEGISFPAAGSRSD
jgi:DNA-binding response OmpR family regulator